MGSGDNGLRENCISVYGFCSNTVQSLRPSTEVTVQEISTDVGLGPQLSCGRGGEGLGGAKRVGESERALLDVAYQTWQEFVALWLMGESTDPFSVLSSSISVGYCFH